MVTVCVKLFEDEILGVDLGDVDSRKRRDVNSLCETF